MQAPQGEQLGPAIIECIDVHKWFGTFHALRGCSLTVQEKRWW
jgi:ABC-type histidine transport system ATPase subunit